MRRLIAFSTSLILAGCAAAPKAVETPAGAPQSEHTRGEVIGLTADDLIHRFGTPALQIREGDGLKLQFRSPQCVLDTYLYPTGNAPYRVTYVDARTRALGSIDQALCIDSLEAP